MTDLPEWLALVAEAAGMPTEPAEGGAWSSLAEALYERAMLDDMHEPPVMLRSRPDLVERWGRHTRAVRLSMAVALSERAPEVGADGGLYRGRAGRLGGEAKESSVAARRAEVLAWERVPLGILR